MKVEQLPVQWRALRDEIRLADQSFECFAVELAVQQGMHRAPRVHESDHVIDAAAIHQDTRIGHLLQLFEDHVERVVQIDAIDLAAWHHDVVDRDLFQVEDVQQHLLMALRDHRAGLVDHGSQLFATQCIALGILGEDPQQAQHRVGHQVDQPDQRKQQAQQRCVDPRRGEGKAFRVQGSHGLGRNLGENQHHQGQQPRGNCDRAFAAKADRNDRCQRRCQDIHEVVAQQDQPDQAVGLVQQPACQLRPGMAGVGEVAQSVAVERHQRGFGAGKERRQEQEEHQCAEQGTEGQFVQEGGSGFLQSGSLSMSRDGRCQAPVPAVVDWQRFAR